jgi:hypothetical protein
MLFFKQYGIYKIECEIEKVTEAVKAKFPTLDKKKIYVGHDWHDLENDGHHFQYYVMDDNVEVENSLLYTLVVNCKNRTLKVITHIGYTTEEDGESFKVDLPEENSKIWKVLEAVLAKAVSTVI